MQFPISPFVFQNCISSLVLQPRENQIHSGERKRERLQVLVSSGEMTRHTHTLRKHLDLFFCFFDGCSMRTSASYSKRLHHGSVRTLLEHYSDKPPPLRNMCCP
ncbi:unnamed protein product [Periconia digitata]|uniref:Uncharacterized protein n=1 Tax=Periconia digitata TaxID=1303443 RepID=A0A9W4UG67_9PLEO|nr:unnamed protein product [Periconia digitata]